MTDVDEIVEMINEYKRYDRSSAFPLIALGTTQEVADIIEAHRVEIERRCGCTLSVSVVPTPAVDLRVM